MRKGCAIFMRVDFELGLKDAEHLPRKECIQGGKEVENSRKREQHESSKELRLTFECVLLEYSKLERSENKTEEVRLLTDSLECLVRRLTFILLEQVSSLEPLYENHPPLIACQRPCPRPTKSQLLTVGPGATF